METSGKIDDLVQSLHINKTKPNTVCNPNTLRLIHHQTTKRGKEKAVAHFTAGRPRQVTGVRDSTRPL